MNKIAVNGYLNRWNAMLNRVGLGQKNHIDLPQEVGGIIPDSSYMNRTFGTGKWSIGDLINLGVGQGLVSASPLQMGVVASILANGGYRVQPHLVRSIRKTDGQILHPRTEKTRVGWIEPGQLQLIRRGMRLVVTEGGGRYYANLDSIKVAGKTGTAQNPHGDDHSWFIAFAPMDDPEIAISVLVENAGYGSLTAAPIGSFLIEKYLNGNIAKDRNWIYQKMLNFTYEDQKKKEDE
jgi:penicillin-binding protein 2